MHRAFCFALASLLVLLPPTIAHACSCVEAGPCHPLAIQAAMFVGETLSVRVDTVKVVALDRPLSRRVFRFRVIESFSSSPRVGDEVEVSTGFGGGDCGYGFEIGERYLVDAYSGSQDDGRLSTSICSNTRPESQAIIALAELRTRASGGRVPDLNGQVSTIEGIDRLVEGKYKPLANVAVTITSENGATTLRASTDSNGIYSFATVPPGTYRVAFDGLPPHRVVMQFFDEEPLDITIPESSGAGASCHLGVFAAPSGGISGQMVDASGTGVEGVVEAYPADQPKTNPPLPWASIGTADKQGHFTLNFLRDGDYRIEYWGSGKVDRVTVRDGQTTTGVQLPLPSK